MLAQSDDVSVGDIIDVGVFDDVSVLDDVHDVSVLHDTDDVAFHNLCYNGPYHVIMPPLLCHVSYMCLRKLPLHHVTLMLIT